MGKIMRFIKTAGVYFLGNVFTKMISFLLLPLYTSKIEPEAYGEYGLVLTILNVITPIVFFSIWDAVFRFSFDFQDVTDKYSVLNNGFAVMLSGSALLIIGMFFVSQTMQVRYPALIFFYALAMGFQYFYTVIARAFQDNGLFVLSGCINSLISTILNIVLIAGFHWSIAALYLSYVVGVLVQIILIERKLHFLPHVSLKHVDWSMVKTYLKFAIPVTVAAISNWLLNGLTQLSITDQLGMYYNGLYNVANKFASILILGIGVFQFAWNELAYDLANQENRSLYYRKSISVILRVSLVGLSCLLILIKLIYPFMVDPQYAGSLSIIPVLLIGTMANAYAGFVGTLFLADKKSFSLFTTTVFSGVLNAIGLLIWTPRYGFMGAVMSLSIAYIAYAVTRVLLLKRELHLLPELSALIPLPLLVASIVAFYRVDGFMHLSMTLVAVVVVGVVMLRPLFKMAMQLLKSLDKRNMR